MKFLTLLSVLALSSIAYGAGTVKVRPSSESTDKCATSLDSQHFEYKEYKKQFNEYYNGGSTKTKRSVEPIFELIASTPSHARVARDMYNNNVLLWANKTIPYLINCEYTEAERTFIGNAMAALENNTCIRFVPYTGKEPTFMFIDSQITKIKSECSSPMGQASSDITYEGKQTKYSYVNLKKPCFHRFRGIGTVLHELMHVLGFFHQEERFDSTVEGEKVAEKDTVTYGPFDFLSASGYKGTRQLTPIDIVKINKAYQCTKTTRRGKSTNVPTPRKKICKPVTEVPVDCPFGKLAKDSVAAVYVDVQKKTANATNYFDDQFATCEIDDTCVLPMGIQWSNGVYSYYQLSKERPDKKCVTAKMGEFGKDSMVPPMYYPATERDNCAVIVKRKGFIICIEIKDF